MADRDDTFRIWQWLPGEPSVFALQADAPIEAKAFLYAAIEQYPPGYRDFYHARTIVAANADAARALADVGTPLIIVLEDAEPGLTNSLVQKVITCSWRSQATRRERHFEGPFATRFRKNSSKWGFRGIKRQIWPAQLREKFDDPPKAYAFGTRLPNT